MGKHLSASGGSIAQLRLGSLSEAAVRTRMLRAVGAEGEKPSATRLCGQCVYSAIL